MKPGAPASTKCSRERAPAFLVAAAKTLLPSLSAALEHYDGEAYASNGSSLLYRESHWRCDQDGAVSEPVVCRRPEGQALARKHIRSASAAQAPDLELRDYTLS